MKYLNIFTIQDIKSVINSILYYIVLQGYFIFDIIIIYLLYKLVNYNNNNNFRREIY